MQRMELLAPAGAWESMVAAVQNGADAVYLGGRMGNARQFAGNFREDDEMRRALAYCHARGVRVYVTLNTLLLDRELEETRAYAAQLYEMGADALILQDLGLLRMLRGQLPGMELHASTQMAVHDENGLRLAAELGLSRAVLARELSLVRIRALAGASPVALECFAHGAMCTAVSGDCLFSSLAGGRSGNRGACAQPCRKAYAVGEAGALSYPLSLQDLCMLEHLEDMRGAGVACIKLEGRMKRPEYVGAMTRAYRMGLDGAPPAALQEEWRTMQKLFSRGGGTGYYYAPTGKDIPAGVEAGTHGRQPEAAALCKAERERYAGERRLRPLRAALALEAGKPARLALEAGGYTVEVAGGMAEAATGSPDPKRYEAQVGKLGGTPFFLEACEVKMPTPAYIPIAALNALRRDAVAALEEGLAGRRQPVVLQDMAVPQHSGPQAGAMVLAIVPDVARAEAAFGAGAGWVALEPRDLRQARPMLEALQPFRAGRKLLLQLPAVDLAGGWQREWRALFEAGLLDGGVAQHVSQGQLIQGEKVAGYLCNAANAQSVYQLQELGFGTVLCSLELNRAQLKDLLRLPGTGLYGYGRAQMMQLWHCPRRRAQKDACKACKGAPGYLRDEAGRLFPLDALYVPGGECLTRVRNCDMMDILDVAGELPRPQVLALEFAEEDMGAVGERVRAACLAQKGEHPARVGTTRGHWARGW